MGNIDMITKSKCILTVDVEALAIRAPFQHVDRLIYGNINGEKWGIGKMMDIADKYDVRMTFFLDFSEVELYGEKIIEAGKYVALRGHDLQVHCHYDILEKKVRKHFPAADRNYYTWYENDEVSEYIIDYCLEQYRKCTANFPIVFRGGEYRFGKALLRKLKEKGVAADASYNYIRPLKKPINKQFVYENGLLELPVGIIPNQKDDRFKVLNFNQDELYPVKKNDYVSILKRYGNLFHDFYDYYGADAVASMMMHSWSFCYEKEHFQKTGYFDKPNPYAADLFERFLSYFSSQIDFITAAQAVKMEESRFNKTVDFDAVFSSYEQCESRRKLEKLEEFIMRKSNGRRVIIWGKGWIEAKLMRAANLTSRLNVAFYISQDADKNRYWRTKPVKTFEESKISPDSDYVFVIAGTKFSEIRDRLRAAGFAEYEDYYDIAQPVPETEGNKGAVREHPRCSICGGEVFEIYNSQRPRRCENCGSVERNRTISALFEDNLGRDLLMKKILHVSPSRSEKLFFRQAGAKDITTLDIRPQVRPDIVADLCDMSQVESESFEIVFANCVLNHVYDDNAALAEVRRVLKGNGLFIVWVMGSGGLTTIADENPALWYGQDAMRDYRVGTYRYYGEKDFYEQLKRYFARVKCYEKYDAPTGTSCCWYVCTKGKTEI